MSWRIVNITKRAKLDLKMNYLVVRNDEVVKIHLSEISMLIIESTAVSLTVSLLSELSKRKIKVIFCDEKRNPSSELVSYYGSHDTSLKIKNQIDWEDNVKVRVWNSIVKEKITKQAELLRNIGFNEYSTLIDLSNEHSENPLTREAQAAKLYFRTLFGTHFSRASECSTNAALDYGYSILLSTFNREVTACGYITQVGISHDNRYNHFNLTSDLMEPFRPLVDRIVVEMAPQKFESDEKMKLISVLNEKISIGGKTQFVSNAIRIYCKSVFDALGAGDPSLIRFYEYEL